MNDKQLTRSVTIINNLVNQHESMRSFARKINEDVSDVVRWKKGQTKIKTRAIVTICRLYGINPHELRPDWFPSDLKFVFQKDGQNA